MKLRLHDKLAATVIGNTYLSIAPKKMYAL